MCFLITIAGFFISLYITKYVSLSSMFGGVVAIIYAVIMKDSILIIVVSILTAFVVYRHRSNIKRIINKTEPKVSWLSKKKKGYK